MKSVGKFSHSLFNDWKLKKNERVRRIFKCFCNCLPFFSSFIFLDTIQISHLWNWNNQHVSNHLDCGWKMKKNHEKRDWKESIMQTRNFFWLFFFYFDFSRKFSNLFASVMNWFALRETELDVRVEFTSQRHIKLYWIFRIQIFSLISHVVASIVCHSCQDFRDPTRRD